MTESEWLTCDDPALMLAFLRDKSSEWKLRLFVCACCREMWRFLDGQHIRIEEERRQAVEVAERFADGQATHEELAQASEIAERFRYTAAEEANKAMSAMNHQDYNWFAVHNAKSFAASAAAASVAVDIAESTITAIEAARNAAATTCLGSLEASWWGWDDPGEREEVENGVRQAQCGLLKDLFGNPFQPVTIEPSWRAPGVVELTQAIYDERSFDRLPELAVALEQGGCTNEFVLSHCQQPSGHVRGCWVIDMLLGKQ